MQGKKTGLCGADLNRAFPVQRVYRIVVKEKIIKTPKADCDHTLHRIILAAALFVLLFVFVDHVVFA